MTILTNLFIWSLFLQRLVQADTQEISLGNIKLTPGLRARVYEANIPDDATSTTRYSYLASKQYLTDPGSLLGQANGVTSLDINYVKGISPTIYGIEIDPSVDKFVVELHGYYYPKTEANWRFSTLTWASEGCYHTFEPSLCTTTSSLRRNMYLNPDGSSSEMMCYQDNDVKIQRSTSSNEVSSGTSTPIGVTGGGSNGVTFPINRYYPFKIVLLSRGGSFNVMLMPNINSNWGSFNSGNLFSNPDEDYIYTDDNIGTAFPGNCPVFTGDKSSDIVVKFRQLVKRDYCESLLSSSSVEPEPSSTSEPVESSTDPVVPSTSDVESSTSDVESSSTVTPIETSSSEIVPSSTVEPIETSSSEIIPSSTVDPVESSSVEPIETSTEPNSTIDPVESSTSDIGPNSTSEPSQITSEPQPEPSSTIDPVESSSEFITTTSQAPIESSTDIFPSSTIHPAESTIEAISSSSIDAIESSVDPAVSTTTDPVPSSTEDPIESSADATSTAPTTPSPDTSAVIPPEISTEVTTYTEIITSTTIEYPSPETTTTENEVEPPQSETDYVTTETVQHTTTDGKPTPIETDKTTNPMVPAPTDTDVIETVTTHITEGPLHSTRPGIVVPSASQGTTDNQITSAKPITTLPVTTMTKDINTAIDPTGTGNSIPIKETTVVAPGSQGDNNVDTAISSGITTAVSEQKNPTDSIITNQTPSSILVQTIASSKDQWNHAGTSTLAPYEGSANSLPLQPIVISIIVLLGFF